MEETSVKALIIGVNIFVSAIIFSLIIVAFTQMKGAYVGVHETDTSIAANINEYYYDYDGKTITGI